MPALAKSTKGKHKLQPPAHSRLRERLPTPGSSVHPMEGLPSASQKPRTSSASSFDPLAPAPPVPIGEAEAAAAAAATNLPPKSKSKSQETSMKKRDPFAIKPMQPLHAMQEQYHPGAAAQDQQKRRQHQEQAQYTSKHGRKHMRFTPSRHWHGNVNQVMRGPPGMAPAGSQRPGLPQEYRYPGVAV